MKHLNKIDFIKLNEMKSKEATTISVQEVSHLFDLCYPIYCMGSVEYECYLFRVFSRHFANANSILIFRSLKTVCSITE